MVTGAARGIGRACAVRFAQEGADIAILDVAREIAGVPYPLGTESQLDLTAELCREQGAAVETMCADVRDAEALRIAVGRAFARFGTVDALVNNAGIAAPAGKPVHEIAEEEWQLMLDIDLSGAWRMTRLLAPHMVERRAGSIVNIASTAGVVGYRHFAGYVAAKHGLVGLTRASALDLAPLNVRVNAICPGSVRDDPALEGRMLSEIARSLDIPVEDHEPTFSGSQPMNRLMEADDVAEAAAWLASDRARHVTGSVTTIDGGYTAR
jgi:NAD(P)-dependent dehydrogenase (short-subunit alcohol dehydrogenase family)